MRGYVRMPEQQGSPYRNTVDLRQSQTGSGGSPLEWGASAVRLQAQVNGVPSTWGAWRAGPGRVGTRNELFGRQVALCRLPLPGRGHQPRRVVVFPLPTQPPYGR